jgi:hypothetical protein
LKKSISPESATPAAVASTHLGMEFPIHDEKIVPSHYTVEWDSHQPRRSTTCVITLFPTHYLPCWWATDGYKNFEYPVWTGRLWDAHAFTTKDGSPTTVAYAYDDKTASRDAIVRDFQLLAPDLGFTHCEVRDYSTGDGGNYIPLFGGILPSRSDLS